MRRAPLSEKGISEIKWGLVLKYHFSAERSSRQSQGLVVISAAAYFAAAVLFVIVPSDEVEPRRSKRSIA
jgi:hypothetical protein